ncbi:hypothetical protein A2881_05900 [Candidatus Peribacteria bacterium RIFCSPHIGHO2_01_FULL_55_13]|nr:MAG: hypothetical protein A2881_05900 [Candidatus Peribacteria bacterium RIFCSPHIGHO2_01_FULL_55_13]
MKRLALFLGLLLPAVAFALSFEDQTDRYTDAPFNSAVTAGVSVLTEAGAIEGNPDGTFMPDRLLNRAEFLKIVLKSYPSSTVDTEKDAGNCFPDVGQWDWFSAYVCYAKAQGIVGGYPDGYFRPENSVNHAEALKMLGELYGLINNDVRGEWFVQYREGAYDAGVGLPGLEQNMEHLLTRGEMARLAAAYLAHSQDQLEEYRAMERGERTSASSSAPTSSSAPAEGCCSSSSVMSASSTSSSGPVSRWTHPTPSRFLIVGSRTMPIASGVFQFSAPVDIRSVTVEMKKELRTLKHLHLVDNMGRTLITLKPDTSDINDRRWKGEAAINEATVGPGSIPLGIEATIKTSLEGGFPEEFVEVKTMSMIVALTGDIQTSQAIPVEWSHPAHQTANAIIEKVENAGPKEALLELGTGKRIGEFRLRAQSTGATLVVRNLQLTPRIGGGINVSNWHITRSTGGSIGSCSLGSEGFINCPVTEEMGTITGGALTLVISGDISLGKAGQGATLQLLLNDPGSLTTFGAVQWTDGTGEYRWLEGEAPLATGTGWEG